ncbi:NB-ARC domain-containing protein [Kamptonema formosum]|uniref:NB-ARC domain-containing protein n=1 Tax=Kamptonema formosum TaxID=331992 RepID=UPI0012DC6823|nr:NB-ARC domain-containing protein [Oscillatoria sp. PCC 10802]
MSPLQKQIIQRAWEGQTYDKMEVPGYTIGYIEKVVAPTLWKLLSEVIGEQVTKKTFQIVLVPALERRAQQQRPEPVPQPPDTSKVLDCNAIPRHDWDGAPDVSVFYGRTGELATLEQSIVKDGCRLVAIWGLGGIGKTALAARLAQQIQDKFELVIWRSLAGGPLLPEFLADLVKSMSNRQEAEGSVSCLIHALRQRRCLVILDDVEALLRSDDLAGKYREQYKDYEELIRQVAVQPHHSCLLLVGREQPRTVSLLAQNTLQVRSLPVEGLQEADARKILEEQGLSDPDNWGRLIELYRGNPASLKVISKRIQILFQGEVSKFINLNTVLVSDICELLDSQFSRLSSLEEDIMYWLAIVRTPVSFSALLEYLKWQGSKAKVMEALESLERRLLMEKSTEDSDSLFTLQPVVMKYVTVNFTEEVIKEILDLLETEEIDSSRLFRSHALVTAPALSEVGQIQFRLIITSIKSEMLGKFRTKNNILDRMERLLSKLQGNSLLEVGYAADNLHPLLASL